LAPVELNIAQPELTDPISAELIIIDNDNISYMLYQPDSIINVIVSDGKILLKDGVIEGIENNLVNDTAELNVITNKLTKNSSILYNDKYSTYKQLSNRDSVSLEALHRKNARIINNYSKRAIIKTYASGKVLFKNADVGNMLDIIYDEDLDDTAPYHTIVTSNDIKIPGKKIIRFTNDNNVFGCQLYDSGEKTFVFLMGPIGSGKSSSIKKVRSMFNMSGALFIAQIDKLVESDIEYIVDQSEFTYMELRKKYNGVMDELIKDSMNRGSSIILETTHADLDYINAIKLSGYKVALVVIKENFDTIVSNIKIRNSLKIRKTSLTREKYNEFYSSVEELSKSIAINYIGAGEDSE
jgi:hypothetical protein